ncbi:hypothetical protein [Streptomyces longwoodensis]|uniref:hypothetical protein n=1 Tax=Streptomyces longwoodensis TaxID=68231 RepID=UPI0022552083|nr:hypothetical protein [Streptomyces longwoodensis]MCX5000907.1 hypothetical protein [Streptomyces longwoodensis]
MIWMLGLAVLTVGYALGRYRPLHRASDWAHWQTSGHPPTRRTRRWWTVFIILSAENLAWLAMHPVPAWQAWQHRNDPPPPRSPAPAFDPDWAAKRRAATNTEDA